MKKLIILTFLLVGILGMVGCSSRNMNDIIENEPSITGVVEEINEGSILISIQTEGYPGGAKCSVSLDTENNGSMTHFNVGDEVVVYFDGVIAESYPLQIHTVYAITLKTPANEESQWDRPEDGNSSGAEDTMATTD